LKGHHKTIATVHDPATALLGENAYRFMIKSFFGSHVNVWNYESKMIEKKYGPNASMWLHVALNKMTWYFIIHFSIMFAVYHVFGYSSFIYNIQYVTISIVFAELVNYIEHYGLLRKKDANGVYESVNKMHSWNYLSGAVLIRLQRHSDHHAHSFRPYQILRRFDDAPYMPYEYLHMYMFSLVPPLWFHIMDPRVQSIIDYNNGKKNQDQWNYIMKMSDSDKWRIGAGWLYLALFQVFLTYMAFTS
jgi:alkane 1-monooxygenase